VSILIYPTGALLKVLPPYEKEPLKWFEFQKLIFPLWYGWGVRSIGGFMLKSFGRLTWFWFVSV
jgi:hypothetical protein